MDVVNHASFTKNCLKPNSFALSASTWHPNMAENRRQTGSRRGYLLDRSSILGREWTLFSGSGKSPGLNRFVFPEGKRVLGVSNKDEL